MGNVIVKEKRISSVMLHIHKIEHKSFILLNGGYNIATGRYVTRVKTTSTHCLTHKNTYKSEEAL